MSQQLELFDPLSVYGIECGPGDGRFPIEWSYSRRATLEQCPRRYYYQYYGAATLHQGTADPIMLVARSVGVNMANVAMDVHATAQLNWSSPKVAQRLPIVLKRTDHELENRAAQEIRRIL